MSTSKAAQVAAIQQTCRGCGLNKKIRDFGIHPPTKKPYKTCTKCRGEKISLGRKTNKAKRAEAEAKMKIAEARAIERRHNSVLENLGELMNLVRNVEGMAELEPRLNKFAKRLRTTAENLVSLTAPVNQENSKDENDEG